MQHSKKLCIIKAKRRYYEEKDPPYADAFSLVNLGSGYGKGSYHVFYFGKIVKGGRRLLIHSDREWLCQGPLQQQLPRKTVARIELFK